MNRTIIDLGWAVARYRTYQNQDMLDIITPADTESNPVIPAMSITIYGKIQMRNLRDFLNDVLEESTKEKAIAAWEERIGIRP